MSLDRIILAFAGTTVLLSLVLAHWAHPGFLFLTAFVGLNLLQSGFTGFCPLAIVLKRFGVQAGCAFS